MNGIYAMSPGDTMNGIHGMNLGDRMNGIHGMKARMPGRRWASAPIAFPLFILVILLILSTSSFIQSVPPILSSTAR
jgi:hypothetical protein